MITIHHLETSRSERIVWLMEELGLDYRIDNFPREASGAAPTALKAIHALGKAPVITDDPGDGRKLVLAESGAIVEYLVNRYGDGRLSLPVEHPAYSRYLYWLHFAEGSLMTLLLTSLTLSRIPEAATSPVTGRVQDRLKNLLAFIDGELGMGMGPWFAGEQFTAADVMMVFPFTTLQQFMEVDIASLTNIVAYLHRIEARPAWKKAMDLAGPRVRYR